MEDRIERLKKLRELKLLELELIEGELSRIEEERLDKSKEDTSELSQDDKADLLLELKAFPRYYKNGRGEVYHETGIKIKEIIEDGRVYVKLFDRENKEVKVEVSQL